MRLNVWIHLLLVWMPLIVGQDLRGEADNSLLERLDQLELQIFDDPLKVPTEAKKILDQVSRAQDLRVWLRAWCLSVGDYAQPEDIKDIDSYIMEAESAGLLAEVVRLLLVKTTVYSDHISKDEMSAIFEKARRLSTQIGDSLLISRVFHEEAYYFYTIDRISDGLHSIDHAIRAADTLTGENEIWRCENRSVLAALFSAIGEEKKALKIYKDCIQWARGKKHRSSLAAYTYNAASMMIGQVDQDPAEIMAYFEATGSIAREVGDLQKEASSYYGRGRFMFQQKSYAKAEAFFRKSLELFSDLKNDYFLQYSYIYLAACSEQLDRLDAAVSYLIEAEKLLGQENAHGELMILDVKYGIARKRREFERALSYLEKKSEIDARIRKETEEKQTQKMSVILGLKLEEERSAKLQEKNSWLQKQNESQARELLLAQRLQMVAVVLFLLFMLTAVTTILAIRRGRQVTRAKGQIQFILDTIDEGLLTIDSRMCIQAEHSAFVQRLFRGQKLAGRDIFSAIFQNTEVTADELNLWRESLRACLGEDAIAWELNSMHLPHDLILSTPERRILSLHWQPIIEDGQIRLVILSVRDVSSVRALEIEVALERQRREGLQSHIMEILSHNFYEAKRLILSLGDRLPTLASLTRQDAISPDILRSLHTDKGVARSLGLKALSQVIHDLESALQGQAEARETALENLKQEQASYAYVLSEILSSPEAAESHPAGNLLSLVNLLMPELDQRLRKAGLPFEAIEVHDGVVHWDAELLPEIRDILVHGLTNALDHGFILPYANGKSLASPQIAIHARRTAEGIELRIQDNGAGLDWDRIAAIAKQRGFVPASGQTLADVLLLDRVSTASQITESSGRGVGLAAVREICQRHRGSLKILSNPNGPGTLLDLHIPLARTAQPMNQTG